MWRIAQKILGATIDGGGSGGGSGAIVTGAAPPATPADPTKAALFYPTGGGDISEWDVASQTWI